MPNVTVSVIMGVYNTLNVDYLNEAVSSIINQTFKDWEFIIYDDGSNQETKEILRKIEQSDNRIRVIYNDCNNGLAHALNTCISESRGLYIARQDDDDLSEPNRLEYQVEFLERNKLYSVVGTRAYLINDEGIWGTRGEPGEKSRREHIWGTPYLHPTTMFRKEVFEVVVGYRVATETRRAEDYDLFMRIAANDKRGYVLNEVLYKYREDVNSIKKRKFAFRVDEMIVRLNGYRAMKLNLIFYIFIFKPIIIGIIPQKFLHFLKKKLMA